MDFKHYQCVANQTLRDIATELTVNTELVGKLAYYNQLPLDTVFRGGEVIIYPADLTVNAQAKTKFDVNNLYNRVATGAMPDFITLPEVLPRGIGYDRIGLDNVIG